MSLRQLVAGFASLGMASLVAQVSGFAVLVVIARRLSPAEIGAYSYALGIVGYFAIPANFGVTGLAIRDLAQRPHEARHLIGEVTSLQLVVSLVPYGLLVLLAPLLAVDAASRTILPVVGAGFVIEGLSLSWVLYGGSRFGVLALARVAGAAAFGLGCLLWVKAGPHAVQTFGWVTLSGIVATAVLTFAVGLRDHGRPRPALDGRRLARRFRAGLPLGLAAAMISVYYTIDSVMLGALKGTREVGLYAIAYKVPLAVTTIAALWGSVLFPHASKLGGEDRPELARQLTTFASVCCVASLPVVAGAALVGPDLLPALFGAPYAPAGTAFVLLMVAAAIVLVTINYGTVAVAIGDERHYAVGVGLAAGTNVVVNVALIPPLGMEGAALATIAAELVAIAYVGRRVALHLGSARLEGGRLARAAGATAVMVAVLVAAGGLGPFARVALGAAVFAAAAAALRVVRASEVRPAFARDAVEGT